MSNFAHFQQNKAFAPFTTPAIAAEQILHIDPAACILNCRRSLEAAVKWMYSVDCALKVGGDERLAALMDCEDFRDIVGPNIWRRMDLVRKLGNQAAHSGRRLTEEQAVACLENLYIFLDFVAYCYGEDYVEGHFDRDLIDAATETPASEPSADVDLAKLMEENRALREELTRRRENQQSTYSPKPPEPSEYETRKIYIDSMLMDVGWTEGRDWLNEVKLPGMPNKSEVGYADYVLYDDALRPLAVIEAKRTCVDVVKGRQQAKLYADILEKQYGRRPIIFLTNGFETRIDDGQYPERRVAAIWSKRDLEKLFNLRSMRLSLKNAQIDHMIAGRYYQEAAIRAVCDTLEVKNRRKALLVMATGSGKTRTVIALCKVLLEHGWVRNILFLADRNALVTQAKRAFVNLMPDLSLTNLCEEKDNYTAHCVFSTYQTMMNCIDEARDEEGKLFTCGHFDLVICDEAHRSIYNKFRDIFTYFDAPLIGLTATPKDEIEKNTYEIFELPAGTPTYGYELAQAVKDGYLVDFLSVETKLKFIEEGIVYDDLSEEDKAAYEDTFSQDGDMPDRIGSAALNEWVFNEDTIRQVLNVLMTEGLRVDYGQKIGKTIIFAKNHNHAEKILEAFGKEYPRLAGQAKVIDNRINYAQSLIDEFSDPKKPLQIAISVDMLDTGIDVPEVLNLVFFKKVLSRAKFWQMIGRGTRLCPGLIDGVNKSKFYIFDFCGNFEFFRMYKGKPSANQMAVQGAIFNLKAQMVSKLQDLTYQTPELIEFRKSLVEDMTRKVRELNRENFAVKQHLKYVERYSEPESYTTVTYEDTLIIDEELSPLIVPDRDDPKAMRFDALMYGIELAYLVGKKYTRARKDLLRKAEAVAGVANIPAIMAQGEFLDKLLHTNYLDNAGINEFEEIRERLRDLIKYIPAETAVYTTDFDDSILSVEWNEAELDNDDLAGYKARAEFYIREHQNEAVIAKLRGNIPLTREDIDELESILWSQVGTREEYEAVYGKKPLGDFVRELTGLDMNAAKEAFAAYLNDTRLDARQIYFVNQIVEYVAHNGVLRDYTVFQEPPFTDRGSIVEIFTDMTVWLGIKSVIDQINANAAA